MAQPLLRVCLHCPDPSRARSQTPIAQAGQVPFSSTDYANSGSGLGDRLLFSFSSIDCTYYTDSGPESETWVGSWACLGFRASGLDIPGSSARYLRWSHFGLGLLGRVFGSGIRALDGNSRRAASGSRRAVGGYGSSLVVPTTPFSMVNWPPNGSGGTCFRSPTRTRSSSPLGNVWRRSRY